MTGNIKILDCTLRDGGRVIDCAFPRFHIDGILNGLTEAGIDIIELGFLRGNVEYKGDSTFFAEMAQARQCVPEMKNASSYVLFCDYGEEYGMWDFRKLPEYDGKTIAGIRLGFRKKDFAAARDTMCLIREKGYDLFVQMVETRHYSDLELVSALTEINKIKPYALGIVDTFGTMYKDDVTRIYMLADHNLDDDISIDFHSHNNMQLSFSFAQEIIEMSRSKRKIILDATLNGMGKGAGNLNTELIVEYLNGRCGYSYDFDRILDTIDDHILWIKREHDWGYSVPSLMAGVFSSHPNNVSYLLKKNRLQTKDIRYILAMTDAETRKRYDYENIDRLYLAYSSSKFDDKTNLNLLKSHFKNKGVLVVVFGATSREYRTEIVRFIRENRPVVISVNHVYCAYKPDFLFYGNHRRYGSSPRLGEGIRRIITSNIPSKCDDDIVVDYSKVISLGYENYDNTTVMLLNLLRNVGVKSISIAGLDGYAREFRENYADEILSHNAPSEPYDASRNEELSALLKHFAESLTDGQTVRSITPGRFQSIFEGRST